MIPRIIGENWWVLLLAGFQLLRDAYQVFERRKHGTTEAQTQGFSVPGVPAWDRSLVIRRLSTDCCGYLSEVSEERVDPTTHTASSDREWRVERAKGRVLVLLRVSLVLFSFLFSSLFSSFRGEIKSAGAVDEVKVLRPAGKLPAFRGAVRIDAAHGAVLGVPLKVFAVSPDDFHEFPHVRITGEFSRRNCITLATYPATPALAQPDLVVFPLFRHYFFISRGEAVQAANRSRRP